MNSFKPTKNDLLAAKEKTVTDVIKPGLKVLFCGINPGLYTAAIGHHFGRPGNRFWPTLYKSGFTDRLLTPYEEQELLGLGYGITNLVARATATAAQIRDEEYVDGRKLLEQKVRKYYPSWLAIVGIEAFKKAFAQPKVEVGFQEEKIGETKIWVLPNPSGLNASYNQQRLIQLFSELRKQTETP